MKKRAALLGILLAVSLPLVSWMASPPEGSKAELAHATAVHPNGDAVLVASPDDPSRIGPAVFPHDEHVEDMEIECKE